MNILYICTHNRCRSILSEAITNQLGAGKLRAYSAGSQPAGEVHPLSLKYLKARGYSCAGLKSQSWDEYENEHLDLVITVCDTAAKESCPLWFGDTHTVHWSLPDPSKLEGSEQAIRAAFFAVMDTIESRVKALLELNLDACSRREISEQLHTLVTGENE